ncbi:MAG: SgcJ/EcaC family oxidoreductase [Sphingorhabdus sp.]
MIRNFMLTLAGVTAMAGVALPALAQSTSKQCPAVTQQQVDKLFDEFNAAWATKNPDTVTGLFTKDAVLLATVANKPRTTHPEIRDYFVSFLKNSPVGTIDTSTYKMDCNSVARLGTWTVVLTDPATAKKTDVKARYSFIYKMEDGKWKIDHLHSSVMPEKADKVEEAVERVEARQ